MKLKPGASLRGVHWKMFEAAIKIEAIYERYGQAGVTITSGGDGVHGEKSKHYEGLALDFRTWHILPASLQRIAQEVRSRLGDDYDVVLEEDHLHVEYDPKPGGST